ncbi:MAG: TPM domain-containing protein [Pedobacter sp.]|nr:TPM domain-containing protein [Pedobacter sp.]MDQ8053444.1 TPM domain-containing protein [Pedobacter sp.]
MKKLFILTLLLLGYQLGFSQEIPAKPATYALVHDFTGTLSADQRNALEQKLRTFEDSTSNQVAVILVKTTGDYEIGDYALEIGRKWGIGTKDKNNGIIVLAALGDRKVTIQVGYGLEGAMPDIYTKRIRENDINPNFRAGDYYKGLDAATSSIISAIKGEYKNDQPKSKKINNNKGSAGLIVIVIIIIIIAIIKRGGGGGSQVIGGRGVAEALFWSMLFSGGGRSSGGSGFGGGSSGGGFGGGSFGGGSFGGGGSSGSW